MKKIVRVALAIGFVGSCLRNARAFQSGQHQLITNKSVALASVDCPDIQKFSSLISGWSWGIGGTSNMSGFDETVVALFGNTGNPAEELAHLGDQTVPIDATSNVDGGNYGQIIQRKIPDAFLATPGDFSDTTPGQEGAYVWMGAAVHLIEDQASPPHGANIVHDISDNFEGPFSYHGSKSVSYSKKTNQATNIALGDLYGLCQAATQNQIANNAAFKTSFSSDVYQDWLLNTDEIVTTYDSVTPGADPQYGQYGGIALGYSTDQTYSYFLFPNSVQADLYSEPPNTAFVQQSVQAGDYAYNFLEKMSRSLAPIVSELSVAGAPPTPAPAMLSSNTSGGAEFAYEQMDSIFRRINFFGKSSFRICR